MRSLAPTFAPAVDSRRQPATGLLAACLTVCAGLVSASVAAEQAAPADLLVMLQGDEYDKILEAASASGAKITHELPIISAIGARMSASQLEELRELPFVERVIDDLAYEPEPEISEDESCPLAGSLELAWEAGTAHWQLFNKSDTSLALADAQVEWPEGLGTLRKATIAGEALELSREGKRRATARLRDVSIPAAGSQTLSLQFANEPALGTAAQRSMTLRASAGSECEAELVSSYLHPEKDSYFPTASGAARLHRYGVTGKGVTVAVLDSGLWEGPAFLRQDTRGEPRVLARYDAIAGKAVEEALDESGHGTHMTSAIADSRPVEGEESAGTSYRGIAPDAALVAVRAFDRTGEAGFLDIVRGIQWVVENRDRYGIRVLNLSFASRPRWPYYDDPVNQAVLRAWAAGIVVIAAAGNEGPAPMTVGSPGNLPYVITVGAITDNWTEEDQRDDYLPDFSSRGPTPMGHIKPDVVAFGGHITGTIPAGASLGELFPEYRTARGEFVMTGTSQAAAVVSGLAALLIQVEPSVSNDDVKCMLMSSAQPAISEDGRLAYSPFLQGSGLVDVSRALTLGERGCGNADLNLEADLRRTDFFRGPALFPEDGGTPYLPGQEELISETAPEKGMSSSRRWGAAAHIERLADPNAPSPIDWLGILRSEEAKIRALASESH